MTALWRGLVVVLVVVGVSTLPRARWLGVSRAVFGQAFSCRVAVAGVFVLVGGRVAGDDVQQRAGSWRIVLSTV